MVAFFITPAFYERLLTGYFDYLKDAIQYGPGLFNPLAPANPAVKAAETLQSDVMRQAKGGMNEIANANSAIQNVIDEAAKNALVSWFVGGYDLAKRLSAFSEAAKSSPFLIPISVDDYEALLQ